MGNIVKPKAHCCLVDDPPRRNLCPRRHTAVIVRPRINGICHCFLLLCTSIQTWEILFVLHPGDQGKEKEA